jgi:hypothetical protein
LKWESYDVFVDKEKRKKVKRMKKLQNYLKEGESVGIECKGKGREYELTYEGSFTPACEGGTILQLTSTRFGIGDTIQEFIFSILNQRFSLLKTDRQLKMYMEQGWNIFLSITSNEIEATATRVLVETDDDFQEEKREGKGETLEKVLYALFPEDKIKRGKKNES